MVPVLTAVARSPAKLMRISPRMTLPSHLPGQSMTDTEESPRHRLLLHLIHPKAVPPAGRIFASPRARKTAREHAIDLALLTGSGPNGRIVEQDVLDYAALKPEATPRPKATPMALKTADALGVDLAAVSRHRGRRKDHQSRCGGDRAPRSHDACSRARCSALPPSSVPMSGLRRIIAERMAASDTATARVTLVTEADATPFVEAREQLKASVSEAVGLCTRLQ